MKKERITTFIAIAFLLVLFGQTNAFAKPTIKEIRFESPSSTVDRIIFEMNGPYIPTGKALPGENPRIYFDFPDAAPSGKIKNRIPVDGNFIKQIRHAYHKSPKPKTRVVFDLVANTKMDFSQDFNNDTNTLVISIFLPGTKLQPAVVKPEPAPKPEPKPVIAEKPPKPEPPAKSTGKKMQPIEDVGIAAAPTPAKEKRPVQATMPKPEPKPEPTPEPEPIAKPAKPSPPPVEEQPKMASLPTQPLTPAEEATVIQPMSEVGIQKQDEAIDAAPVLYSIEYNPKSNRGEMISFKLNGFHPPVVFGIEEDIPRIVCFFKNASAGPEVQDLIGTSGQFVKNIRIGKYQNPDNIRVVLELVPGNNYDLQQIFFKDDKVFMLIINKAGKQISTN